MLYVLKVEIMISFKNVSFLSGVKVLWRQARTKQNLLVFYAFLDTPRKPNGLFDKCALLQKTLTWNANIFENVLNNQIYMRLK